MMIQWFQFNNEMVAGLPPLWESTPQPWTKSMRVALAESMPAVDDPAWSEPVCIPGVMGERGWDGAPGANGRDGTDGQDGLPAPLDTAD